MPKPPKARHYLEDQTQAAVIAYLRLVAPHMIWASVPNGGYRTPAEAAKLKWTGVLAGFSDIIGIAENGLAYCLEVKTIDGDLSEAQREFKHRCDELGAPFAIVRSVNDARDALRRWRIPTRETKTIGRAA